MVYPFLSGSALLRTQRTALPRTFLRYKSITAAIERGRRGGPDRPFRPRTRSYNNDDESDRPWKAHRDARPEPFGPSRDLPPPPRRENERVMSPRSSRFGRVRRDEDAPSRSTEASATGNRTERSDAFKSNNRYPQSAWARTGVGRLDKSDSQWKQKYEDRRYDRGRSTQQGGTPGFDRAASREFRGTERRGERSDSRQETSRNFASKNDEGLRESRFSHRPDSKGGRREREHYNVPTQVKQTTDAPKLSVRGPESLPYTTAASEFIYGHSSVLAAIKANRRKFYKIYVQPRGANRDGLMSRIRAQKLFSITQEVGDEYVRAFDKASNGRPHNGVILESSPLPVPPITELKTASIEDESFSVGLDSQSVEDVLVNGKQELYAYKSGGWRYPLILYVDGVVDEGNLGAIARSAYVLGADAIITPTHHTAVWSNIALKASAGAAEAIPLFKVGEPTEFLGKSSRAGWRLYASDAVPRVPSVYSAAAEAPAEANKVVYSIARSTKRLPAGHSPVAEHPTILMMGAEGTGLKTSLVNLAHYKVGIPHGREVNEVGVDSLNVSVAASILCYEMLQRRDARRKKDAEEALF